MKRIVAILVCAVLMLGVSAQAGNPFSNIIPKKEKTTPRRPDQRKPATAPAKPTQQKPKPATATPSKPKPKTPAKAPQKATDDINKASAAEECVVVEEKPVEKHDDNKVFDSVEQDPQFPGGQEALLRWLADHICYPAECQENGIQGKVTVQFVVKKDGSIGTVKIVRGKDPDLDKEAIRVVKSLPKFTPGKMNGHTVNVWYTLPITFRLRSVSTE